MNSRFFRVHNSYLVNLNHIKKYTKGKGGYITLTNNENIDVSHRRKDMFLKIINQ
ncbi:LytTR family DNA-binding domain-containing protein [Seonamhaeicola sp. S2-3]|uniref:LytTR family DNA-binding domain-containing protein n=1 Tax=Seonamhaeicola sp. S2-3 TaxID=1936081 RepID=UPI0009F97DD2|nr:LytTR family DNA-binding domain-containing protein [Seonamhaeicola sp. S2-3]